MAQEPSPGILQRLSSRDPAVRTRACAEVLFGSQLGLELGHLVEPLIDMLDDEEPDLRYLSAVCLGAIGDGRAVLPLIDRLGDQGGSGDRLVRCAASEALEKIGDSRAIQPMEACLARENDRKAKRLIHAALKRLRRKCRGRG